MECYNCGRYGQTEEHHALHGTANRKICDGYPLLKFDLCPECHRGTNGVHGKNGHDLNLKFKKTAQILFETHYGTREEFIKLFGRNYLE
jgi:hypothetical protein